LVTEAFDWAHGVFLASNVASEGTAAAETKIGAVRRDPFAMLPFCGYNMADYFAHWLKIGRIEGARLPRIFMVNWFRKSDEGKFLWPGFGENSRVLAYVLGRLEGKGEVRDTPIGLVPTPGALPLEGLDIPADTLEELLTVDPEQLRAQLDQVEEHLDRFGDRLPAEVRSQFESLKARLG